MDKHVGIIGAGIAGLTAGRWLQQAGLQVTLFDKGRRPGGRCSTRQVPDLGLEFDHGAQYFTVRDPGFEQQVENWVTEGLVDTWTGMVGMAARGQLEPKGAGPRRYIGVPSMAHLGLKLAEDLPVHSGIEVNKLHHQNGSSWIVEDTSGNSFGSFDWILCTAPAAQTQRLVSVSLPLVKLCQQVQLLPCWATMVAWSEPISLDYDALFIGAGALRWAARNRSKPGRSAAEAWVLHSNYDWAQRHLEAGKEPVAKAMFDSFSQAVGLILPKPAYLQAHRWRYAMPVVPDELPEAIHPELRLSLAGDWLGGARLEGAYLSGKAAAEGILRYLR